MEKAKLELPANRVATIVGVVTGLVAAAPAIAAAFAGVPGAGEVILGIAGLATSGLTVYKFLVGAQKWEELSRVPVGYDPFDYDDVDEGLGTDDPVASDTKITQVFVSEPPAEQPAEVDNPDDVPLFGEPSGEKS